MHCRHAAQIAVVGVEALGRLVLNTLYFGVLQLGRDRPDHARGHLILQIKYVLQRTVEPIGPKMGTAQSIYQLTRDTHSVAGFAQTAFKDIANAQRAADLFHVYGATLVGEARITRDNEQPWHAREGCDDLLD